MMIPLDENNIMAILSNKMNNIFEPMEVNPALKYFVFIFDVLFELYLNLAKDKV